MTLDINNISKQSQIDLVQGNNQRKQPDNFPHSEFFKNIFSCKVHHQSWIRCNHFPTFGKYQLIANLIWSNSFPVELVSFLTGNGISYGGV